nr:hypothetical protein [Rhizobium leguminosarum]
MLDHLLAQHGTDVHLDIGNAGIGSSGPKFDIVKTELLTDLRAVGDITRQAVRRKAQDDIDPAALYIPQQLLDAGSPLVAGPTDRAVREGAHQIPAMLIHDHLAALDLRLDRLLILAVGRIARVNDGFLGHEADLAKLPAMNFAHPITGLRFAETIRFVRHEETRSIFFTIDWHPEQTFEANRVAVIQDVGSDHR